MKSSDEEITEVLELLKNENQAEIAKNAEDSYRGGCVGSEVWGGLRFYLLKIPKGSILPSTQDRVSAIIASIDKIMPR
jgi:hypothetical protein